MAERTSSKQRVTWSVIALIVVALAVWGLTRAGGSDNNRPSLATPTPGGSTTTSLETAPAPGQTSVPGAPADAATPTSVPAPAPGDPAAAPTSTSVPGAATGTPSDTTTTTLPPAVTGTTTPAAGGGGTPTPAGGGRLSGLNPG